MLQYIIWDVRPEVFSFMDIPRWYGVFWAIGVFLSFSVGHYIFKVDGQRTSDTDRLAVMLIIGTLVGARLGHVLFYDPLYYWQHPINILPVSFEPSFHFTGFSGLASHGGGLGMLAAAYIFTSRRKKDFLWILDRIAVIVPLCGAFIRLGNLMNSEMIGIPSDLPWAFIFTNIDNIPRHPGQLYEAILYALVFALMFFLWRERRMRMKNGALLGIMISILFSIRFLVEFLKINQEVFEDRMALNMGQLLSIPFIVVGIVLTVMRLNLRQT